jgi:hypothetical protein
VLKLIQFLLHVIDIIFLRCIHRDTALASILDAITNLHTMRVFHFLQQVGYFALINGSSINVIHGTVHLLYLDIHILEYFLKITDILSNAKRIHLLHASLKHWEGLSDGLRDILCAVSALQFGCERTHFDPEALEIKGFLPISDYCLCIDLGIIHIALV